MTSVAREEEAAFDLGLRCSTLPGRKRGGGECERCPRRAEPSGVDIALRDLRGRNLVGVREINRETGRGWRCQLQPPSLPGRDRAGSNDSNRKGCTPLAPGRMEEFCAFNGSAYPWDWNQKWHIWDSSHTRCLLNTILVWIPCAYLWLLFPFYFLYLRQNGRGYIRMSHLFKAKMAFGFVLILFCFCKLFFTLWEINQGIRRLPAFLLGPAVLGITLVLVVFLIQYERTKGVQSSGVLIVFWLLSLLAAVVPFWSNLQNALQEGTSVGTFYHVASYIYFTLVLVELITFCLVDQPPFFNESLHDINPCPEISASFFSKITFWWLSGLILKGCRKPLELEDLWSLTKENTSAEIVSHLEREWRKGCDRLQRDTEHVTFHHQQTGASLTYPEETQALMELRPEQSKARLLLGTLWRVFGAYFLLGTLSLVICDVFLFSIPKTLSLFLEFMKDTEAQVWKGYFYAALLFLLACVQTLFEQRYMYMCCLLGMRLKTAVLGLVYRKILLLTNATKRTVTAGEIVNLVSVDVQKLMDLIIYFNGIWLAPVRIIICFIFLWQILGPSALSGIIVFFLVLPLNFLIAKRRSQFQVEQMKHKDKRARLTNEMLSEMRTVKLHVWEEAFSEKVLSFRERELGALKASQVLFSLSLSSFHSSTFLVAFIVFAVYTSIDEKNVLDAERAFVALTLIHILNTAHSFLPFCINAAVQAKVSLNRLAAFLSLQEMDPDYMDKSTTTNFRDCIQVKNGTFAWSKESSPCLKSINLSVPKGCLLAIVGQVGAGKSSLLSSLIGEMEKLDGYVSLKGSVAYVPQQAWIQNATVKNNITFGQELDESWYNIVVDACALQPDFDNLPAGSNTEIGEKGINLSGGQKQRLCLARAVYKKASVYLLDDPLSAVDASVGQHIFENIIGPDGLLKDRTRVVVTNAIAILSQVDKIVVLVDGEISEAGPYHELLQRNGDFADFLRSHRRAGYDGSHNSEETDNSSISRNIPSEEQLCRPGKAANHRGGPKVANANCMNDKTLKEASKLTETDRRQTGRVNINVYLDYLRAVGPPLCFYIILLLISQQAASFCRGYWLSLWADDPVVNGTQQHGGLRLGVFGVLGLAQALGKFGATSSVLLGGVMASRHLFLQLLRNVVRCPLSFFEQTPIGNLLNRFSKDMDAIDAEIPDKLKSVLGFLFTLLEIYAVIIVVTPIATVVIAPLTVIYVCFQSYYVSTSCQLKRLESSGHSPIYSHFSETFQGGHVIRAFGEQRRFILQNDARVDISQRARVPAIVADRWLATNLEFLGSVVVLLAVILAVDGKNHLSPGIVGFSVSYALQVTGILNWIVRSWSDVENNIVSVERVREYSVTPKEAPWILDSNSLSNTWPADGRIEFRDYGLKYQPISDFVLKNINITINQQEKIGIAGRTGAGKSSLAMGLLRLVEAAQGQILIDGINIADLGLHELRKRITFIPQDPVLLSGSLRLNLDPLNRRSDEDIWAALGLVLLKDFVLELPDQLNHQCSEGGGNLSVGQKHLLCLARAFLQKSRIVVLDEATAGIDLETDDLIQSAIKMQFKDCTVLTIAHRISTIMDCTRQFN
ncbi:multidrug resistance-associated protein 1 isoform X2 [Rhinatrema bivittatum]|uniref:multidrug resistance-associated protein 1 isoform X2 n=1 Tax=Rhinatrema bivittatum TaxID=194408 RepID=UPI00112CBAE4|nr:multidrug resistance-associated protein 1 isoform X2 [Rhinatrema bivittatum]